MCQFTRAKLTVVHKWGRERAFTSFGPGGPHMTPNAALGFLFTFTPKYTLSNGIGTTFFSHICDISTALVEHCPVCALALLLRKGCLRPADRTPFDPLVFTPRH